jgi:hypothetical protein
MPQEHNPIHLACFVVIKAKICGSVSSTSFSVCSGDVHARVQIWKANQ